MDEVKDFFGRNIQHVFEDLGLVDYYPGKITIDIAKANQRKKIVDTKDIPWAFLENVINPEYDGRTIFFVSSSDDTASISSEDDWDVLDADVVVPYTYIDIAVTVFMCCDNECKTFLSNMLHKSGLSAPIVLPDMSPDNGLVVQISALRGITEAVGYDTHIPIVSFVCVNGDSTVKTKLINMLLCTEDDHKPFYNHEVEVAKMPQGPHAGVFGSGVIEAALSNDLCKCHDHNHYGLFLNLYDMSQDFKVQRTLVCQISTLVVVYVDTFLLSGNTESVNNIRDICAASKKALVVFDKQDSDDLERCKKGVQELIEAIKGVGCQPQVMVLFHRGTGQRDNVHMIRGNLRKKIKVITDTFDKDETTLKEELTKLDNVTWDSE